MESPGYTTYSFLDLSGALAHPELGAYVFTGQGVGSVTVSMDAEKSAHDLAADGSVMISKLAGFNGKVSIACQQTSALHKWLLKASKASYLLDTASWATMSATLRNTSDGTAHLITGMSFGKQPDISYAANGAQVTWQLWAAIIQSIA